MNWRILFVVCCLLIISCKSKSKDIYDLKNYLRITTQQDSLNNMYVVYQSQVDRTRTLFKSYWYNGRPQSITFFHNAKKNGPSKLYLDNGILIFEGNFFEDKEDGSLTYYYPNGVIKKAEEYNRGKIIKTSYYNSEGVLNRTELNK